MDMLIAALVWHDAGCSVIPVSADGTKSPLGVWKPFQEQRATRVDIERWFSDGHPGIGVVCGAISGQLEMLELESVAVRDGILKQFAELCDQDLFKRICAGYSERSPSDGVHLYYRIADAPALGNTKLARRRTETGDIETLIETRGTGGYVIVAPSHGAVHDTGRPWSALHGTPADIVTITAAERDELHAVARSLDDMPAPEPIPDPIPRAPGDGLHPGEDYNARGSWSELLTRHGWSLVRQLGDRAFWRRPGKAHGISAVTGGGPGDFLYVWSTSTELPAETALSKWRAYAMLEHAGDFSRAASELRRGGYGSPRPAPTAPVRLVPLGGQVGDADAAEAAELDSWQVPDTDLADFLTGRYQPPAPTVGARNDGVGLFYPGLLHSVAAESEAGKTWLALLAARAEIERGRAVVYVDFEDSMPGVVGRLRTLGASADRIRAHFRYVAPNAPITAGNSARLFAEEIAASKPTLVILDGITEAMGIHGLDIRDNMDVVRFGRLLPHWIADAGSAVVMLDHVTKDRETRGRYAIGGAHKLNGINGAAFLLENRDEFGIGRRGASALYIVKDRPAQLKRHAIAGPRGLLWFADLVVDSVQQTHDLIHTSGSIDKPVRVETDDRPVHLMAQISALIARLGRPLSGKEITDRVKHRRVDVLYALATLVDEGHVIATSGPRGAILHTVAEPFHE